jgi:hypothetical protein
MCLRVNIDDYFIHTQLQQSHLAQSINIKLLPNKDTKVQTTVQLAVEPGIGRIQPTQLQDDDLNQKLDREVFPIASKRSGILNKYVGKTKALSKNSKAINLREYWLYKYGVKLASPEFDEVVVVFEDCSDAVQFSYPTAALLQTPFVSNTRLNQKQTQEIVEALTNLLQSLSVNINLNAKAPLFSTVAVQVNRAENELTKAKQIAMEAKSAGFSSAKSLFIAELPSARKRTKRLIHRLQKAHTSGPKEKTAAAAPSANKKLKTL